MRSFIFLWFALEKLLESASMALYLPQMQYDRVLIDCQDKLVEWEHPSTATDVLSPARSWHNNSVSLGYPSGIFMRGRWKQATSYSPAVRPSFLPSSTGNFDFFSSEWNGPPAAEIVSQNITASMWLFRDHSRPGPLLQAAGIYNSKSGEVCLVACLQVPSAAWTSESQPNTTDNGNEDVGPKLYDPFYEEHDQICSIRGLLTISNSSKMGRLSVNGTLESLRSTNDSEYFTSISLAGNIVNNIDQRTLYSVEISIASLLFGVEAAIVIRQLVQSKRSPSGVFVSMLMILVQIVVMCFIEVRLIYVPLRLLRYQDFKYLITTLTVIPLVALAFVIFLNLLLLFVILKKRRIAKRMNVDERPRELRLAFVCVIIYATMGLLLWSLRNFETYLQLVWCWFLVPQLIANVSWDLRMNPLHATYIIGLSLCRIVYIGFNSLRPTIYGYDDLNDFPRSWFLGITSTVLFFAFYALVQQRYGGRSFIPPRWFGYQQLPASHAQANQERISEDRMFDL